MSLLPARYRDDLDGTEVSEDQVKKGVRITVGTHKGTKELDLKPEMYEALVALADGDPALVRAAFTPPAAPSAVREVRSKAEMARIRAAARAARNPDGSEMFPGLIKDRGRQPDAVYTWYYTEYLPAVATREPTEAVPTEA